MADAQPAAERAQFGLELPNAAVDEVDAAIAAQPLGQQFVQDAAVEELARAA